MFSRKGNCNNLYSQKKHIRAPSSSNSQEIVVIILVNFFPTGRHKITHSYFDLLLSDYQGIWSTFHWGRQRIKWLDSITNSMDKSLSKLREIVKDRDAWPAPVHWITKSGTQLNTICSSDNCLFSIGLYSTCEFVRVLNDYRS